MVSKESDSLAIRSGLKPLVVQLVAISVRFGSVTAESKSSVNSILSWYITASLVVRSKDGYSIKLSSQHKLLYCFPHKSTWFSLCLASCWLSVSFFSKCFIAWLYSC